MEILHNNFSGQYNNFLTYVPPVLTEAAEAAREEERKSKVTGFFDKLFGFAGQASDIYTTIKAIKEIVS